MIKLSRQIKSLQKDITNVTNDIKKTLAQEILLRLVNQTPADTSKAISNWQVSLANAKWREVKPYFVGKKGSTADRSAFTAYEIGNRIISRAKVGESIYITHDLDYITLLNFGSSPQAEAHFIENAFYDAIDSVKRKYNL